MKTKKILPFLLFVTFSLGALEKKIDSLMQEALATLKIPGAAVAVISDDQIVLAKGYGVKSNDYSLPVTKETVFGIASCSKAFTSFALGQLVDKGLIDWDDPVIQYIPEFRLYDIHATHHITIRDLLTHRSGLPRHEVMWYYSTFPRSELLYRLPNLPPTTDLREKFQYNNLMYVIAGLVIEKVTGRTWEEFVIENIFTPLEMRSSCFSIEQAEDFAAPHQKRGGKITTVAPINVSNMGPAMSIYASAADIAKWVALQLSNGKEIITKETLDEMHTAHVALSNSAFDESPYIFGYGLGWAAGLYKGRYAVMHSGALDGFLSAIVLLPQEKIGVAVFINSDEQADFPENATCAIADILMDEEDGGLQLTVQEEEEEEEEGEEIPLQRSAEDYIGQFTHLGYGVMQVFLDIPREIQKLDDSEDGARNFDQAQLSAKQALFLDKADAAGAKVRDAGTGSDQLLNHERYKQQLMLSYNGVNYILKHMGHNYFIASSQSGSDIWYHCCFFHDSKGNINQFHFGAEPTLSSYIPFIRKQD